MRRRGLTITLLLLIASAIAGCATTGAGIGFTSSGSHRVMFRWKSAGNVSGSMSASLANGTTYSGQYFQITSDTRLGGLGSLWAGWEPEWGMDEGEDWYPGAQFMTDYSGRVVANLASAGGVHMRCRFRLIHPAAGMAGGGRGVCRLPDGSRIDAQFPSA